MKLKKDSFVLRKIADDYLVIPIGDEAERFKGVISLNETGAFIWELLEQDQTVDSITEKVMEEYDISFESAQKDITLFLQYVLNQGCCE